MHEENFNLNGKFLSPEIQMVRKRSKIECPSMGYAEPLLKFLGPVPGKLKENERKKKDHDMQNEQTGMKMTGPRKEKRTDQERKLEGKLENTCAKKMIIQEQEGNTTPKKQENERNTGLACTKKTAI